MAPKYCLCPNVWSHWMLPYMAEETSQIWLSDADKEIIFYYAGKRAFIRMMEKESEEKIMWCWKQTLELMCFEDGQKVLKPKNKSGHEKMKKARRQNLQGKKEPHLSYFRLLTPKTVYWYVCVVLSH